MVCRKMEVSIFPRIAAVLSRFVEARLHTDGKNATAAKAAVELQGRLVGRPSLPAYIVLDPQSRTKPLGIFEGGDLSSSGGTFKGWLERILEAQRP